MNRRKIHGLLTRDQCCPNADRAAAAIIISQDFLDACRHLKDQAVLIAGQCLATDSPSLFSGSTIVCILLAYPRSNCRVPYSENL
jgi:sterol carrier protein 2